jgi:hypothetical protein
MGRPIELSCLALPPKRILLACLKSYPVRRPMRLSLLLAAVLFASASSAQALICTLTAVPELMHVGDSVPPLIYNITGCAAITFTGAPSLTTVATSTSVAGSYTITIAKGTMASTGNTLSMVNSTIQVIPADAYGATVSTIAIPRPSNYTKGNAYPVVNVVLAGLDNTCAKDVTASLNTLLTKSGVRKTANGNYYRQPMHLYFPAGCYRVSGSLNIYGNIWSLDGDGPGQTTIKVAPNSTAFQTTATNLFKTNSGVQGTGNQNFQEFISNMDIDVGYGNPLLNGIQWIASNVGAIANVRMWCEDQGCNYGVAMNSAYPGPSQLRNLSIYGFKYGLYDNQNEYLNTIENLTLEGQTTDGIYDTGGALAVRHMLSYSAVTAFHVANGSSGKQNDLLDSELIQVAGSAPTPGVYNGTNWSMYLKNIVSSGYNPTEKENNTGTAVDRTGNIKEAYTGTAQCLFCTKPKSLDLPVQEVPVPSDPSVSTWLSLSSTDPTTWAGSLSESTSSTAYVPPGVITLSNGTVNVTVPDTIDHINCYGTIVSPPSAFVNFVIAGTSTRPLVFDNCQLGFTFYHTGSRAISVTDASMAYNGAEGAGNVFITDAQITPGFSFYPSQSVWGRQFDVEGAAIKFTANGSRVWLLGYKTERILPLANINAGSQVEIFNWFGYPISCPVTSTNPAKPTYPVSLVGTGGTVSATLKESPLPQAFAAGDRIVIAGATAKTGFNASFTVLGTPAPTTTTFSYRATGSDTAGGSPTVAANQCSNVGSTWFNLNNSAIFANGYEFGPSSTSQNGVQYMMTETQGGRTLTLPATNYTSPQTMNFYYSSPFIPPVSVGNGVKTGTARIF